MTTGMMRKEGGERARKTLLSPGDVQGNEGSGREKREWQESSREMEQRSLCARQLPSGLLLPLLLKRSCLRVHTGL